MGHEIYCFGSLIQNTELYSRDDVFTYYFHDFIIYFVENDDDAQFRNLHLTQCYIELMFLSVFG